MARYLEIADGIATLIKSGALRPGDAIPSVREASTSHRVSKGTIVQAYGILEMRGLIEPRPRSGYYVQGRQLSSLLSPSASLKRPRLVEISRPQRIQTILSGLIRSPAISLGSSFPSHSLYPLQALNRALAASGRRGTYIDSIEDLQLGLPELRRAIAQRYLKLGYSVPLSEIVITCGGMEAISLSLQTVTKPGDVVVVDSPMFFSGLALIEHLQLRPIEMPVDPREGLNLSSLSDTLRRYPVTACLLMTNCQNPVGFTMSEEKKLELVALLTKHRIPLIENDVYGELQFGYRHIRAAKAFDQGGGVLHCGSFTKSLAPGYKIGWVSSGRFRDQLLGKKFISTLGTSIPPQRAIAQYLDNSAYDRHLRQLRHKLMQQVNQMTDAVDKHFPKHTALTHPTGGYVIWVRLPEGCDAFSLFEQAASMDIGIAPGPIFSASRAYRNFIRLNCGHPWSPSLERAVRWLGGVISRQLS
ncbi:MAG: PLP-dependent aminotransferase family protein [Hyphomicrobiaceae bacterium]|nr:MAG: PLP-dependent aminotransferase family protein [Hyphomicrobiaceae bacterium]